MAFELAEQLPAVSPVVHPADRVAIEMSGAIGPLQKRHRPDVGPIFGTAHCVRRLMAIEPKPKETSGNRCPQQDVTASDVHREILSCFLLLWNAKA